MQSSGFQTEMFPTSCCCWCLGGPTHHCCLSWYPSFQLYACRSFYVFPSSIFSCMCVSYHAIFFGKGNGGEALGPCWGGECQPAHGSPDEGGRERHSYSLQRTRFHVFCLMLPQLDRGRMHASVVSLIFSVVRGSPFSLHVAELRASAA